VVINAYGLMAGGIFLLCVAIGILWWIIQDPERYRSVHREPPPVGRHRIDGPLDGPTRLLVKTPFQPHGEGHMAGCLITRGVVMLSCPGEHDPADVERVKARLRVYEEAARLRKATPS
jgi:hypothetical protein